MVIGIIGKSNILAHGNAIRVNVRNGTDDGRIARIQSYGNCRVHVCATKQQQFAIEKLPIK